jgi:hypothetical protein
MISVPKNPHSTPEFRQIYNFLGQRVLHYYYPVFDSPKRLNLAHKSYTGF